MNVLVSDRRLELLVCWLSEDLNYRVRSIEAASSDASFRRYFRVRHEHGCQVVMDAPPERETTDSFVRNAALLGSAGVRVPKIFAQNAALGFLLLEDFGTCLYADGLNEASADALYLQAMDSLFRLQSEVDIAASPLPAYDEALLERELSIFRDWFLQETLALACPQPVWQTLQALLIDSALQQPRVCVHRDYHSRNLMILKDDQSPGVLDFQDAVIGPVTYDLVSLLKDCYVRWPQASVERWLRQYFGRLLDAGMVDDDFQRFNRWFDWMGLQRHLKAVGIFSRLHLRDGKAGYLQDIPRTLGYIADVCSAYPELQEFNAFLQQSVLPAYRTTP